MASYLQSITVTDKAGSASDSCSLKFNDKAGQIKLPQPGASVQVLLQGLVVFSGFVEKTNSSGSRSAGRTLSVSCKGFDTRGKAKEPQRMHQDSGTIEQFMKTLAQKAGFNMKVDPAIASITRDYLAADQESLLHMGQKLARELGGTFKLKGTDAVLAKRGSDNGLPIVSGIFTNNQSGNVISWNIEPRSTRDVFNSVRVSFFDRNTGAVKDLVVANDSKVEGVDAVNQVRSLAHDEAQAKDIAEARKQESDREGGSGTVKLDIEPTAQAEALFQLSGTRPGVDGLYRIESVTHSVTRSSGSATTLSLKQPHGEAGIDTR